MTVAMDGFTSTTTAAAASGDLANVTEPGGCEEVEVRRQRKEGSDVQRVASYSGLLALPSPLYVRITKFL